MIRDTARVFCLSVHWWIRQREREKEAARSRAWEGDGVADDSDDDRDGVLPLSLEDVP